MDDGTTECTLVSFGLGFRGRIYGAKEIIVINRGPYIVVTTYEYGVREKAWKEFIKAGMEEYRTWSQCFDDQGCEISSQSGTLQHNTFLYAGDTKNCKGFHVTTDYQTDCLLPMGARGH